MRTIRHTDVETGQIHDDLRQVGVAALQDVLRTNHHQRRGRIDELLRPPSGGHDLDPQQLLQAELRQALQLVLRRDLGRLRRGGRVWLGVQDRGGAGDIRRRRAEGRPFGAWR